MAFVFHLFSISESFGETTPLRSSSTFPWRCWAWTWCFWSTPGCPPGVYMDSVWLQRSCFTTSSWHRSPGWDWKPFICILHLWKSLTSTCLCISWNSVFWDGVSLVLPADIKWKQQSNSKAFCPFRCSSGHLQPSVHCEPQRLRQQLLLGSTVWPTDTRQLGQLVSAPQNIPQIF